MFDHKRISRRFIALAAALAVLLSITQTAAAAELAGPDGQPVPAAEEVAGPDNQPVLADESSEETAEDVWSGAPVGTNEFGIQTAAETGGYTDPSGLVQGVDAPTTYQEVYDRMIAFKSIYPEGLAWTNYTPYGNSGPLGSAYTWQGGSVKGARSGVGCAAFVFILSDAAFGSLPARTIDNGGFTFADVQAGDILRINNNSHFVIVLQKTAAGVTVAEANYNSSVHWGRALSEAEVMAANFLVTRYPENFVSADTPDAGEITQSGTEENLSWSLTKAGVLTISGSGAIPDYSPNDDNYPGWHEYDEAINTIIIENGVTGIGDYAFYQSKALSVYIPDGVTSIGQSAFYGASLLAVTIPGSVETVGDSAFRSCENITSVTISDGVTTIGENTFRACTTLAYIDFPASVTSVGSGAFMSCAAMTRVRFMPGNTTVHVGDNLFTQCQRLTDVTLPQTIDRIGDGMFESCTLLFHIYIPAGVTEIGENPFAQTALPYDGIYFGGSEAAWKDICATYVQTILDATGIKVYFDIEFDDPFAVDPNDPGDMVPDNPGGVDPDNPGGVDPDNPGGVDPDNPGDSDNEGPDDNSHNHSWSENWTYNSTNHWHECEAEDCLVTDNSQKNGYAEHSYGSWVTDMSPTAVQNGSRHRDCTVCGYRQTESIPATGSSSNGMGASSGGSNNSTTTTVKDPESSTPTTTTTTDTNSGAVTETTQNPDGSSVVTTTQRDGTVAVVTTDAAGRVKTEVQLPAEVISTAQQSGEAASLPIAAVQVVRDVAAAPAITVYTAQSEDVKVAIPAASPTAGTVAVLVNPDGSTEILKSSVAVNNSVVASVPDGATVKIVDNSKSFSDVPGGAWSEDAVTFVAARELFVGITENTFAPDSPMTRAMLMTVLARYDGEDTNGGTVWYEKGIEWAIANAISDGSDPNGNITREQLVVMLWRYSGSPAASGGLDAFPDAGTISEYAREAMRWAVENGIISGYSDGRIGPEAQATRAEVAAMLMRYSMIA